MDVKTTPEGWRGPESESWLSIWSRRALSFGSYTVAGAVTLGGLPAWLALALVGDLLVGAFRLPRVRAVLFFALYLACELVALPIALLLGLVTLGGRIGGAERYTAANFAMQRCWTAALFGGGVKIYGMGVSVEGLGRAKDAPMLLFVRHASAADTMLAAALVANPNGLRLRYVMKRELLWDPCLDVVGRRLPNAFIDRKAPRKEGALAAIARLGRDLGPRSAALIYPEGSRFTPAKRARALDKLRELGRDDLAAMAQQTRHVLPPRVAGPLALLDAAPGVDVVILEHAGFDGTTTFADLWRGGLIGAKIRVRLRRVPAAEIPTAGRDVWLYEQWAEVDRFVAESLGG